MRTSVRSVAGAPLLGSSWMKSAAGTARFQTGSSSRPSSVTRFAVEPAARHHGPAAAVFRPPAVPPTRDPRSRGRHRAETRRSPRGEPVSICRSFRESDGSIRYLEGLRRRSPQRCRMTVCWVLASSIGRRGTPTPAGCRTGSRAAIRRGGQSSRLNLPEIVECTSRQRGAAWNTGRRRFLQRGEPLHAIRFAQKRGTLQ